MARRGRRTQTTVVCWLFPGKRNYRPRYVNVLYARVQKFLPIKHRFVCIYDDTAYDADAFDPAIELMPIPEAARSLLGLGSLGGAMHPSCFGRLWHFSEDAADAFPGRVFMFDVDSIPIGDMSHLVKYRQDADFITMLRVPPSGRSRPYITGGSWILRAGAFPEIWESFIADPIKARADACEWFLNGNDVRLVGWTGGSDQSYLSSQFVEQMTEDGPITYWQDDCGILLWDHFRKQHGKVPGCLLHFNGHKKPWSLDWDLTRDLYGSSEYRVIRRPLNYGGKRYQVGESFIPRRPSHAKAFLAINRIEAVG